jgi:hypothetical protein
VLGAFYFLEQKVPGSIPFYEIVHYAHFLLMCSIPILLILPEDNWVWIVEDNPRIRKISLRSKAVKHLHLSMLYLFGMFFLPFIFCVALMAMEHPYNYPFTWFFVGAAFVYGVYCAWKNNKNVRKYESLFAVGWDRRSAFIEIFVGFKVTKDPFFFYSGFSLVYGFLLIAGSVAGPFLYKKYIGPWSNEYDQEKLVVMTMLFHAILVTGLWITTMYVSFQLLFAKRLERWSREPENRNKY